MVNITSPSFNRIKNHQNESYGRSKSLKTALITISLLYEGACSAVLKKSGHKIINTSNAKCDSDLL